MTEQPGCRQVRELIAEVALGVADAEDRDQVLRHVLTCPDCRAELSELTDVVDDLVTFAPQAEPPTGFETTMLSRYDQTARQAASGRGLTSYRSGRPRWRRRVALAASVLLAAGVSGGAVYWSDRDDREVAGGLRRTLGAAHGQYFVAFPLRDLAGTQRGAVFGYQGDPPWLVVSTSEPLPSGRYTVEVVAKDGVTSRLATGLDLARAQAWAAAIPVAVHEVALLRILDAQDRLVLSARLGQR
ncbi:MAG TPA: anti-sigma factor [Kribbellaceae bacterium]